MISKRLEFKLAGDLLIMILKTTCCTINDDVSGLSAIVQHNIIIIINIILYNVVGMII